MTIFQNESEWLKVGGIFVLEHVGNFIFFKSFIVESITCLLFPPLTSPLPLLNPPSKLYNLLTLPIFYLRTSYSVPIWCKTVLLGVGAAESGRKRKVTFTACQMESGCFTFEFLCHLERLLVKPWLCPSSSLYPQLQERVVWPCFFPSTYCHHSTGTAPVRSPGPFPHALGPSYHDLENSPCGLLCSTGALLCCTGLPGAFSLGEFPFPSQVWSYISCPPLERERNSKHSNDLHIGPSARLGLHLLSVTSVHGPPRGRKALGAAAVTQVADVMAAHTECAAIHAAVPLPKILSQIHPKTSPLCRL